MLKHIVKQWVLSVPLIVSFNAQSAIIDYGDYALDTSTGLEWIDLSVQYSVDTLLNGGILEVGGRPIETLRHATVEEFNQFMVNFGFTTTLGSGFSGAIAPGDEQLLEDAIRMFGGTAGDMSNGLDVSSTLGVLADPTSSTGYSVARLSDDDKYISASFKLSDGPDLIFSQYYTNWGEQSQLSGVSHFLVYDSSLTAVPVPAAAWLFGTAMLSLVGLKRRA